ncbi:hypothetical protein F4677DRAFT_420063 [Hypoxylon crocopeplum]|nr:hypothetical protein F4677DRAFT_420063 [Hypoxylon crocopeplum]
MDDLLSSPDPLGDEPPSSAHSYARRMTNNAFTHQHHEPSSLSIPRTMLRSTSPVRKSPRKQTFELDVGNELSPQKILVTVEAEEAMKRGINRRLFPSSSPTRSDRRRETIATTTVPLNDEIENEATPKRRGRPRRTSNGTPMPRGKKRAGTPIQDTTRRTRRKGDPESEASMLNDTPTGTGADSATPKPRARARKTPKKAAAVQTVPSSQVSTSTTKRKRGRPRKALMPEEVAMLADAGDQPSSDVANNGTIQSAQDDSRNFPPSASGLAADVSRDEGRQAMVHDGRDDLMEDVARGGDRTPTPENVRQNPGSPTISHQEGLDDENIAMEDEYPPMMEHHSDMESDLGGYEGVPYGGQDTLTHASDFSMIAVESLPSFQANRSAFPSDPPEMGDETNLIINQTLESLRRSTQTEADSGSQAQADKHDLPAEDDHFGVRGSSLAEIGDYSLLGRPISPRRPKSLPLSRQVFAGKAPHVDDSFSSIPDSILRAATPGRLPMKPTPTDDQEDGLYDDSFSEIPDVVLEAATPKPAARTTVHVEESHVETPARHDQVSSVNRNTGSNFGSSRLPTPDDTSSSNAGSRRAPEEDIGSSTRAPTVAGPSSNLGFRSSPPIMNRPRAMDSGPSQLDQEISNTPGLRQSSPQLPSSSKEPTERAKSLEPPHNSRPSLSPIVRVGRTLQNVMSDRSSPEGRESSLGSPFRGPASHDPPRPFTSNQSAQLSVPESPTRTHHGVSTQLTSRSSFNPNPTFPPSARSSFSREQPPAEGDVIGNVSDPFGPDIPDRSQNEALGRSAYNTGSRMSQPGRSALIPSATSSTRVMPPSDDEMSWIAHGDDRQQENRQSNPQLMGSRTSSIFATHGSNASRIAHMAAMKTEVIEQEQMVEGGDNGELSGYEDDDADIWDIEASRPSPKRPQPVRIARQSDVPPPRRSKLPSPWRRTSRRLIYRQEIASPSQIEIEESPQSEAEEVPLSRSRPRPSDAQSIVQAKEPAPTSVNEASSHQPEQPVPESQPEIQEQPIEPTEFDEYSLLAQRTKDATVAQKKPAPAKSRLFGSFDLLSFFSSPATLPTKVPGAEQANANGNTEKVTKPLFQSSLPKDPERPAPNQIQQSLWSTGLFPSIPQKEFQPSPERRTDLFSPAPRLPSNDTVSDTYEGTSPSRSPSPAPSNSPEPNSPPSPQPSTPERQIYPPIEQKRNFTPRPGQSGWSLFRRGPSATASPPEEDLLQLPPSDQQQESSLLTDGTDYERVPPREKPSQWDKTLSPSKSCFRSPTKPTTPGRVVAFTNSVLSPSAQAQARAEKQNGILSQGPIFRSRENESAASSSSSRAVVHNDNSTTTSANMSPLLKMPLNNRNVNTSAPQPKSPSSRPATATATTASTTTALSRTEWSRQHWLRLDELLQLRRRDPLRFQQAAPLPSRVKRRSFVVLSGKEVAAHGAAERVLLEPWHLDVVDAFRRDVGGWDEHSLARRLFALLVGEERRRAAKIAAGGGNRNGNGKSVRTVGGA